ncbi:MAG: hypothetical protein PUK54_07675 [Firmicutes bacterium]|nr:hypothetical protein [Bacillota bacterium]MDY5857311.1 hypothetical protein [Anaerovoracaceae bacterium]
MKKFLTVLLVIAVMFTFSFSAAFAGTVSADEAGMNAVTEQQEAMAEAVNGYVGKFVYTQDSKLYSPNNDPDVTKAAVDYAVAAIVADYNQAILEAEIAAVADGEFSAGDKDTVKAAWAAVDTYDKFVGVLFGEKYGAKDGALYTKAVEDYAAAFSAKVSAVDASTYANVDAVKAIVKEAEEALAAKEKSADGLDKLVAAEAKYDAAMKGQTTAAGQETKLAEKKEAAIKAVQEAADKYYDAKAAELEKIIEANTSPSAVAQATADLAVLAGNVDKVEALYVNRINAVAITDTVKYDAAVAEIQKQQDTAINWALTDDGVKSVIAQYADVDLLVKYAESLTGALKTQYDKTTGLANYNAATVDKALADIIAKIESLDGSANTYEKIKGLVDKIPTAKAEKDALAGQITAGVDAITTGSYAAANWSGENKDAVEAIQKDYTAKIKAATSADEIDALVKEAKKAMDAYLTTAQVAKVKSDVKATINAKGVKTALEAYAAGVAAKDSANKYSDATKAGAVEDAIDVIVDAAVALQKADLTAKEIENVIDANYSAALAVIDGMKSDAALKAEAQAVIDAIKALPATATLENKAEYLAAKDMLDAYLKNAGAKEADVTNSPLLKTQIAKIVRLEKEAVEKIIRELPRTITIADKAAVEAAQAAADAYKDTYKDFDAYKNNQISNLKTLENAQTALSNAMMTEAAKLIAALPADITAADKDAVKAARAAYDALYDADKATFDKASEALVKKLEAAEKALQAELAYTVESLKITASSKATKGAITVKWTVKGDAAGVEAYEIWKSTKKNSGYSKSFTTSKMSYKNSKGLKKGTRYYYKVRAIAHDAEGKKITSDWSNKAYRIAK